MLRKIAKKVYEKIGYKICIVPTRGKEYPGFVLYSYLNDDGTFNSEKYKQVQCFASDGNGKLANP